MSNDKFSGSLKEKLQLICDKIEQILKEYKESKDQNKYFKQTQDIYNINSGSKINVIKKLKQDITLIQNNLEKIYDINKINKIQSEIKKKTSTIKTLSKEQLLLCDLVKKQQESIEDYTSKFTTNKEISEISNNVKFAKEENHMNRETFKLLDAKIKGQLSKIDVLDKKSKIIRQNIEFQQKKQKKEVEKSINGGENEDQNGEENDYKDDLDSLMVTEKMLILEIEDEERNFKNEINQQKGVILNLKERINNLKNKKNEIILKKKNNERKKKIEIIKNKDKKKNKNQNIAENKVSKNNINYKTNNYQINNYKSYKFIYQNNESSQNKNKNENINFYSNTKSNSKPFDIGKFNLMYNNNYSAKIIMDSNTNLSNQKIYSSVYNYNNDTKINKYDEVNQIDKNVSPLKEIEQLQNEIKYALKNNIAALHTQNKETNDEKKDIYVSTKDNIVRINQNSETNNKKSNKPFEKFNFN